MSNSSKNKKKRMRTKNKRLQKLKYHEVYKPSEKIDKYEKNHIYFIHDNVKVVPNVSPNNQFESLNTLKICHNINGFKMFTKCKVPIFILIPREESKRYFTKNKMKIINTLEYMRKKRGKCIRGKNRIGLQINEKEKYTTIGPTPNRGGHGIVTAFPKHDKNCQKWNIMHNFLSFFEDKAVKYIPNKYVESIYKTKKEYNYETFPFKFKQDNDDSFKENKASKIWTGIATAINYYSAAHLDNDFFLSLVTCLVDDNKTFNINSEIVTHFCFPSIGYAVALRDGDSLIFNPRIYHCAAHQQSTTNGSVILNSFYLKTGIIGGNDNRQ